jgi:hypothetical protein
VAVDVSVGVLVGGLGVLVGVVSSSSRGVDVGLGTGVFVVASPAITVCRVGAGVIVALASGY